MFRRRRADIGQAGQELAATDGPAGGPAQVAAGPGQRTSPAAGPWDAAGDVPAAERIDFGSLLVPMASGCEVQVSMVDNRPAWVSVVQGDSGLLLQAFAAPKSGGLWAEVRREFAAEVAKSGGTSSAQDGPFGVELRAQVVPAGAIRGHQAGPLEPVRFLGVDGPRWFLRGLISGPAARWDELAQPLERIFAGVVVVRGDHPVPPREMLEIRLPEEALQALGEQPPEPADGSWPLNPFERGPEITETR